MSRVQKHSWQLPVILSISFNNRIFLDMAYKAGLTMTKSHTMSCIIMVGIYLFIVKAGPMNGVHRQFWQLPVILAQPNSTAILLEVTFKAIEDIYVRS